MWRVDKPVGIWREISESILHSKTTFRSTGTRHLITQGEHPETESIHIQKTGIDWQFTGAYKTLRLDQTRKNLNPLKVFMELPSKIPSSCYSLRSRFDWEVSSNPGFSLDVIKSFIKYMFRTNYFVFFSLFVCLKPRLRFSAFLFNFKISLKSKTTAWGLVFWPAHAQCRGCVHAAVGAAQSAGQPPGTRWTHRCNEN